MIGRIVALGAMLALVPADAQAGRRLADTLCAAIRDGVDAAGAGPVLAASYRPGPGETELPPALRQSAFTYDNALAVMALVACGDVSHARRVGDGLRHGLDQDRSFADGRVRNAYRAGTLGDGPAALPGWWDARHGHWAEDAYQDGTATGNVAWAALAMLNLDGVSSDRRYRAAARRMLGWIAASARDRREPDGFSGGVDGFDPAQTRLTWKSTEHNIDVYAVASWLHRLDGRAEDAALAETARGFLGAMFAADPGMFRLGTKPDGSLQPTDQAALDTQLWPLVAVADAPASWRTAMDFAETQMGRDGGFDFNADRDGVWVEGTAQAALTLRALGRNAQALHLLTVLQDQISPSGYLFATDVPRLTTGIAIGPASREPDFFYFRRPHLGATAWGVLAATGWNPFVGRSMGSP